MLFRPIQLKVLGAFFFRRSRSLLHGFPMPLLLPYDALFAIAFAGGRSLSWKIGSTCSSNSALRHCRFLSLLRALFILQMPIMTNALRNSALVEINNLLQIGIHHDSWPFAVKAISEHCVGVIGVMARWRSGHFAWEVRETALMILADFGSFGKQQLRVLREEAQEIAGSIQPRPRTNAWREYQQMMIDCHVRRQCDASLVAHDHMWLYVDPPRRYRPRMFSLTAAPETPRTPTDSDSSCETSEAWQNRWLKMLFAKRNRQRLAHVQTLWGALRQQNGL